MASWKNLFITATAIILTFTAVTTFAQSAKEAIYALKKLEAKCQIGASYRDYSSVLGEAKFSVNLFIEGDEAKQIPTLKESISNIMRHYETAGIFWKLGLSEWKEGVPKKQQEEIIWDYPTAAMDIEYGGARCFLPYSKVYKTMKIDYLLPII